MSTYDSLLRKSCVPEPAPGGEIDDLEAIEVLQPHTVLLRHLVDHRGSDLPHMLELAYVVGGGIKAERRGHGNGACLIRVVGLHVPHLHLDGRRLELAAKHGVAGQVVGVHRQRPVGSAEGDEGPGAHHLGLVPGVQAPRHPAAGSGRYGAEHNVQRHVWRGVAVTPPELRAEGAEFPAVSYVSGYAFFEEGEAVVARRVLSLS